MAYHGLRGSASPLLTATGLVNGRWQNQHPLTDRQKIVTDDYVGEPYSCAKCGGHPPLGLGEWMKYNLNYFYSYPFLGTHLQVRRVDGFSRTMAQTTWTRARMRLLGFVDIAPHLGVKSKKKQFRGRK